MYKYITFAAGLVLAVLFVAPVAPAEAAITSQLYYDTFFQNSQIAELQHWLYDNGYFPETAKDVMTDRKIPTDKLPGLGTANGKLLGIGKYGPLTELAVKNFQCQNMKLCSGTGASNGYGRVGRETINALATAMNPAP